MLKRKTILSVLASIFLLAILVTPVYAEPPSPIHITVEELPGVGGSEPFYASGPAVDQGLVCATGVVTDLEASWNEPSGSVQMIWALKRFSCAGGTFDVEMVVQLDLITRDTTARWRVVDGTGLYADLKGQGSLVGFSHTPDPGILDVYDGAVH